MPANSNKTPEEKFKDEIKSVLFRYSEESDLDDAEMVRCSYEAIEELYGDFIETGSEEVDDIHFEPDFDLENDE